ncbi:MAG: hypothetical protein CVU00_03385 [Bacteroidetes bacterium HGW-Bacteroidetes-17]|jgi:hypothetical protein|nr:MAG: hypothetical protein CVU00_03385 [Bacteroidetes bacterium HGW-Bacteroidetes-17]
MKKLIILLIIPMMFGCSSTKILKFSHRPPEVTTTPSLKKFLADNYPPKVVLRVNKTSQNVTDNENNDRLYSLIDNRLLANGFVVRDRQLFNQIIGNQENNVDYQKLKDKTDTDLIIELTKLETNVLYETNKYYTKKGKEKVEKSESYQRAGASVEFKLVLINSNELAGLYKFYWVPCDENTGGCVITESSKDSNKKIKTGKKGKVQGYEIVMEKEEMEAFIREATDVLVSEMKK